MYRDEEKHRSIAGGSVVTCLLKPLSVMVNWRRMCIELSRFPVQKMRSQGLRESRRQRWPDDSSVIVLGDGNCNGAVVSGPCDGDANIQDVRRDSVTIFKQKIIQLA